MIEPCPNSRVLSKISRGNKNLDVCSFLLATLSSLLLSLAVSNATKTMLHHSNTFLYEMLIYLPLILSMTLAMLLLKSKLVDLTRRAKKAG